MINDEIKKIIEKYEGEFVGYDSYQFLYCKWAKKAADEIVVKLCRHGGTRQTHLFQKQTPSGVQVRFLLTALMSISEWENEVYPKLWRLAYKAGEEAREKGLPRTCNLEGQHCYTNSDGENVVLKVYKSAWEQGWDRYKIPAIFGQMEAFVNQLPLRPMQESDL